MAANAQCYVIWVQNLDWNRATGSQKIRSSSKANLTRSLNKQKGKLQGTEARSMEIVETGQSSSILLDNLSLKKDY